MLVYFLYFIIFLSKYNPIFSVPQKRDVPAVIMKTEPEA